MTAIAVTIAGSDSGGGAGIQADLKTFSALNVYGATVITALTAQNTRGVRAVHAVPPDMVRHQLAALAEDLPPDALKTGMLATAALVRQVAAAIREYGWRHLVVDPVMVATSGDRLLDPEAVDAVREMLLPLAEVVTPNLEEAAILARRASNAEVTIDIIRTLGTPPVWGVPKEFFEMPNGGLQGGVEILQLQDAARQTGGQFTGVIPTLPELPLIG